MSTTEKIKGNKDGDSKELASNIRFFNSSIQNTTKTYEQLMDSVIKSSNPDDQKTEKLQELTNKMYDTIIKSEIRRRNDSSEFQHLSDAFLASDKRTKLSDLQKVKYLSTMNQRDSLVEDSIEKNYITASEGKKMKNSSSHPLDTIEHLKDIRYKKDELNRREKDGTLSKKDIDELILTRDTDAAGYLRELEKADKRIKERLESGVFSQETASILKSKSYMDRITYMDQVVKNEQIIAKREKSNQWTDKDKSYVASNTNAHDVRFYLYSLAQLDSALSRNKITQEDYKVFRKNPVKWFKSNTQLQDEKVNI